MAGTITLSESNNETRIEWKINNFFIRDDNLIISPDFKLFNSKWFLQFHLSSALAFSDKENDSCEPLRMSLLTLNSTTEFHIEYRMGIRMLNGSEITTEKFELVLNKRFYQTPQRHKLISRKDFQSSRNILVTLNTVTVFCNVCLISAVDPAADVSSPILSRDDYFYQSHLSFCDELKSAGDITLNELNNEAHIEWKINDFFNRKNYILNSPFCLIFNLKIVLQMRNVKQFVESLSKPDTIFDSPLTMNLQIPYYMVKLPMEYEMGIQMSNGSEIRTEMFECLTTSVNRYSFEGHKIISRKDFENVNDILDSENTLKVFCTVRLLSDNKPPGDISLSNNILNPCYSFWNGTLTGKISLDKLKNYTRIEWTINHFFSKSYDTLMKSPHFKLFKSNWYLQIAGTVCMPVIESLNSFKGSLYMCLQRDCTSMAEYHIEYRMGIQRSDDSEIVTAKFESIFQPRFKKTLRELIAGTDLERIQHTSAHGNTLKVFCTVRLLNDDDLAENNQPAISSIEGAGTSYENPQNATLTKSIFNLNENAKDVNLAKANSTQNSNNETSSPTKVIFKFGDTFKGSRASHENSKSASLTESIRTLSESFQDVHLTKDISTQTETSEVPWVPKFVFKFGEQFKGFETSSGSSKHMCLNKGIHTFSKNFEDLYQSKRFTDVTVKVKDKEFLVHKMILSTRSEVFASMFEHDTSEKRNKVIHISDCDPHSFENFLLYLYTGKLDTVTSSNAASLFKTADKYGVEELKLECVQCMIREITVGSFCDIFHLAVLHGESDLLATATNFFIRNASAILITKEWLTLLEEHTSLCNELLVKFAKSSSELSIRHNRPSSRKSRDHRT